LGNLGAVRVFGCRVREIKARTGEAPSRLRILRMLFVFLLRTVK